LVARQARFEQARREAIETFEAGDDFIAARQALEAAGQALDGVEGAVLDTLAQTQPYQQALADAQAAAERVRAFGGEHPQIDTYVRGVYNVFRGHTEWTRTTARYGRLAGCEFRIVPQG